MPHADINGQRIFFEDTGGDGPPVSISMDKADVLAAGLSGSGPVVKVGGAHAANLTNPEPVDVAICEFLAGLPS